MKKTVYVILLICLLIGIPMIVLDQLAKVRDGINIPSRFQKIVIDLSEKPRNDELIFERELKEPSTVEFFMQSDAEGQKDIKITSDSEILGSDGHEIEFSVGKYTGQASTSATYLFGAGKYAVYLTSEKADGKLAIGYQETPKEASEFERLSKINNGDLDNPPDGYEEIYSADLSGQSCTDEIIYTLSLDATKDIGLCVYTSSSQGSVSVDLIGASTKYIGLVQPPYYRICDQLETTLPVGQYQFKLTCKDSDGWLYVFLKQ